MPFLVELQARKHADMSMTVFIDSPHKCGLQRREQQILQIHIVWLWEISKSIENKKRGILTSGDILIHDSARDRSIF